MYLPNRFYGVLVLVALAFIPAYIYPGWFVVALFIAFIFIFLLGINIGRLFDAKNRFTVFREFPEILSIGEDNPVRIHIQNESIRSYKVQVYPELPADNPGKEYIEVNLNKNEVREEVFSYRPLKRGRVRFGRVRLFISVFPHWVLRRLDFGEEVEAKVYPSVVQMRKYSLRVAGLKMIQRSYAGVGMEEEFEEIKNYVWGDDHRKINWRASGKSGQLMVNRYRSEQTRDLYCVLDISRPMGRDENGISILEHGINAALVLSHVVMDRNERIGLILVGKYASYRLPPGRHLKRFLEELYDIQGEVNEADYNHLAQLVRLKIRRKSTFLWIAHEEQKNEWKVGGGHICLPVMMRTGEATKIIPEVLSAYFKK